MQKKNLHKYYSIFIYNSPKLETTQMFPDRWMVKQTMG